MRGREAYYDRLEVVCAHIYEVCVDVSRVLIEDKEAEMQAIPARQ
jgi:hypothetical protein